MKQGFTLSSICGIGSSWNTSAILGHFIVLSAEDVNAGFSHRVVHLVDCARGSQANITTSSEIKD